MINIEEMSARAVDENTAGVLEKLNAEPDTALQSGMAERLGNLGLIKKGEGQTEKEIRKEPVPIVNMALFLTQSCNLRCVYCYGDGGEYGSGGSLEEKTACQAVDWLIEQSGEVKKIHVGFFGGEPFLNFPTMKAVTAYAQKRIREVDKAIDFGAVTNATLLDDEKIAFIREHDISVMVSFDGPREIQDAQRPFAHGKGSYDVAVPKMRKLLEQCPQTSAHAVLTGHIDPQRVKDALREVGFTEISMTPVSASLFAEKPGETKPDRDIDSITKFMEREAETWLEYTRKRDNLFLQQFAPNTQLYPALVAFLHNEKKRYPCGAGLGLVGVSCAGDVYLCHRFVGMDAYKIGNVFASELDREKYHISPVTFIEECRQCLARYYCAGGCKHDNASCCGSVFKLPEDRCRLTRREAELAAYIACRLSDGDRAFLAEYDIVPPKPCLLDF